MSKVLYAVTKGRRFEVVSEDVYSVFHKLNVPQFHFTVNPDTIEMWDANDRHYKERHETIIDFEELLERSDDYTWRDSVSLELWNAMKDCKEAHVAILLHY